jgi:hypothetical protein
MILCVVAHCISSPGLVHKITNNLQALNEQKADKDKAKPPVVAAHDYLVTEALTYMADLYPSSFSWQDKEMQRGWYLLSKWTQLTTMWPPFLSVSKILWRI